ncbi:MAG TPA: hypothetical protein VG347_18340 [Verrucomicrobiae bacterium]|nr:hypothetical protein [Verrucomicrobiae bacterium]
MPALPMNPTPDITLDNLTRIVQVIKHDRKLRHWFDSFSKQTVSERKNAIATMAHQMTAQGEDPGFITSFQLLADTNVFEAACLALQE